jgi:hypothetical protein
MTVDVHVEFGRTGQRLSGRWNPNEAERRAAWEMLVELTTRVPVIPLRQNEGLLREALTSLHTLFQQTRGVLRSGGAEVATDRQGELSMAVITGHLLNQVVRPVLAYWHPELGRWEAQRDGPARDHELKWPRYAEFEELLDELRSTLIDFARVFAMVTGAEEFLRIQLDNESRQYEPRARDAIQGRRHRRPSD